MTTDRPLRALSTPVLFSLGLRPFFLFGALWGAMAAPLWVYVLAHGDGRIAGRAGMDWHIHEMLFGYVGAVIGGFLLTAVPNWTGRAPLAGTPLAVLFGLWAVGRLALSTPGADAFTLLILDGLYLTGLSLVVWRDVLAARNWRNLGVALAVTGLAAANLAFHLRSGEAGGLDAVVRAGLGLIVMLLVLIGGRVTPNFTRNWLARQGSGRLPAPASRFDLGVMAFTLTALVAWVWRADHPAVGVVLALAGLLNGVRLARWCGWRTVGEPLVWILHLGYAWLAVGLVLLGLAAMGASFAPSAGVHALTTGAMGVMILAVMTRATRGHTGRPLEADRATVVLYGLANLAAVVRVAGGLWPEVYGAALIVAGGLWAASLLGYALVYGPMLLGPRLR